MAGEGGTVMTGGWGGWSDDRRVGWLERVAQ